MHQGSKVKFMTIKSVVFIWIFVSLTIYCDQVLDVIGLRVDSVTFSSLVIFHPHHHHACLIICISFFTRISFSSLAWIVIFVFSSQSHHIDLMNFTIKIDFWFQNVYESNAIFCFVLSFLFNVTCILCIGVQG